MAKNLVPAGLTPEEVVAYVIGQQAEFHAKQAEALNPKPKPEVIAPEAPKEPEANPKPKPEVIAPEAPKEPETNG